MSRKPSATVEAPPPPLPISGGCYTLEDGVLTPIPPGEAEAPAPVNTPLKEA